MRDLKTLLSFALPFTAATILGIAVASGQTSGPMTAPSGAGAETPPVSARPESPSTVSPGAQNPGQGPAVSKDGRALPEDAKAAPAGSSGDVNSTARSAEVKQVEPLGKPTEMIGLQVVGADGKSVGQVSDVKAEANGKLKEIDVRVGAIFGFGGSIVKVTGDKVTKDGKTVKLSMTSEQFNKLLN